MAQARHKAVRRASRLAGLHAHGLVALTGAVALSAATLGAMAAPPETSAVTSMAVADATSTGDTTSKELADLRERRQATLLRTSRSDPRLALDAPTPAVAATAAAPVVQLPTTTAAFTTIAVNIRTAASKESPVVAVLEPGSEIAVTGRSTAGYAEVVHEGKLAWVYAAYVADTPPAANEPAVGAGISTAPCASGSQVESGLTSNAVAVHRAVCALFPAVTAYGGVRPGDGGEHGSGHALDIMISSDVGTDIAAYLQANAGALGVSELIWRQQIWSTQRAGDGWRWMEDRGSATANHYDHVHVTVH